MSKPQLGAPASFTDIAFDSGRIYERNLIIGSLERQICFDALADPDGRCTHHGGKCYELRQLINDLHKGETK